MPSVSAYAGSVPSNYDKYLGPVLFEPYATDLVNRMDKKAHHILELACGTGRVTRHILRATGAEAKITATDLNGDMIDVAKTIVDNPNIQWMVADAQELRFENESFDTIVCQFGVMFFPDKPKAFAAAHRVLKPGGQFLFNVWDSVQANPLSALIEEILKGILGDDAPDFLSKGPYSFYDHEVIRSMLSSAGFHDISLTTLAKTEYYPTADDYITGFIDGSPLGAYLMQLPAAVRQSFRRQLRERITAENGETNVASPMQAIVVSAIK